MKKIKKIKKTENLKDNMQYFFLSFEGEVLHKYDNKIYELFSQVFCALPLGFVLNKKVLILLILFFFSLFFILN